MTYDKRMGAKIRELREKKSFSLREAAKKLDMDYSYLGRVERGFIPSMKVIKKIADFYEVEISYIMGEELDVPETLKPYMKKWLSVVRESERRGYTPEDIERLLDTLDTIVGKKSQNGDD